MKYILFMLLFVSKSFAGVRVGNGGDALVCYSDANKTQIVSIEMFDYWEQKQINTQYGPINLGDATLTVQDKILLVVNRIQQYDPDLATEIATVALSIADNIKAFLVSQNEVPEIFDANPKALPKNPNCLITQFAIQWSNTDNNIRRFYISKDLYNHPAASNDLRAGLILHEAIYRYAIMNGATNSDGVRFYNFIVGTLYIQKNNLKSYVSILNKAQMNYKQCTEIKSTYFENVYIPMISTKNNGKNCFKSTLTANGLFKFDYNVNQLYYEKSNQSLSLYSVTQPIYFKSNGVYNKMPENISNLELRNQFLTLNYTDDQFSDLKFKTNILKTVQCYRRVIYDVFENTVAECEIPPQNIQLPQGDIFSIHQRVLYDSLSFMVNLVSAQWIPMPVASHTSLLADNNYPVLFRHDGALLVANSLKPLTFNKNGFNGQTSKYILVNGELKFSVEASISPLFQGLRISVDSLGLDLVKICQQQLSDFNYAHYKLKKEYISNPEKIYNLRLDKISSTADTFINILDTLTCLGDFSISANLL